MVPNKYQIIHGWKSNKDSVVLPNQKCTIPSALCAVMSMVINLNWFIVIDVRLFIQAINTYIFYHVESRIRFPIDLWI